MYNGPTETEKEKLMSQFIKDAIRTESHNFYLDAVGPRLIHASMGLVTEAAEFQDALKKSLFYGKPLDTTNLKEEMGDLLWYLALAMDTLETDFDAEQDRVIRKLKARYPSKFDNELAENRDLATERKILETDK
ncbi:putative pyrophosphatase [Pectobacterium phage vB_PcaM_P7_Pc]|nr:putative pyrophosphatase [Pectobacterium phage vB_PcaM_P7_Pc]